MKSTPKILFFDLENAPNLGYIWAKYEQDVLDYVSQTYLMTFAYKWGHETRINAYSLTDFSLYKREPENDRELVKKLWELLNEADIVVAHNGDRFDIRKSNARFIAHGLTPPSPYKTVDTLKIAKRHFMFNSNKLDDLGEYFGVGRKVDTGGFKLWKDCMAGDMTAWKKMVKYNRQDVILLERVYQKLLPWMNNHPNMGLFIDGEVCPKCGSDNLQGRGIHRNQSAEYQRAVCKDCRGWCMFLKSKEKRKIPVKHL